ncbi:Aspartate aminotransferase (AspB-4) [hydrothermal vent metagenome]|uniref:Aspartate aminotransferase (AspB-4) n=1 Tax=hydrothermal vent metagenome TaxID=652676 RepID=A0A3B1CUS3_9ZZZZ
MQTRFSDRMADVPKSFIREILKDALMPDTISFAGGLPNRTLFPTEEIKVATQKVFEIYGNDLFQYSASEGLIALREWIAQRYKEKGLDVKLENILITSGSQQGLDLLGKVLLNKGDGLILEEPGYLGAIQAFALYRPQFLPVSVSEIGMDTEKLRAVVQSKKPKLMYTVPNFQNPSGITYPEKNREAVAEILRGTETLLIEDDPYGDLRFNKTQHTSFKTLLPHNTLLLGSFSKIIVPSFRIGWIVASDAIMQKLIIAKQASDLHTNQFTQYVIHQYLRDNDLDAHISKIVAAYSTQKEVMRNSILRHFPKEISSTNPEGGMFLWMTLPKLTSALDLFELALKDKVVFVPGDPFYINQSHLNTLRLNYSCADVPTIETGMARLAHAIKTLLKK